MQILLVIVVVVVLIVLAVGAFCCTRNRSWCRSNNTSSVSCTVDSSAALSCSEPSRRRSKKGKGKAGPRGVRGPKGRKGPKGPHGKQGPQGEIGETGCPGDRGPKGDRGARGCPGIRGERGPVGAQGPEGFIGNQGMQGPQGLLGPQGAQGPRGIQGPLGPEGAMGLQGPIGVQGSSPFIIPFSTTGIILLSATQNYRFLQSIGFSTLAGSRVQLVNPGDLNTLYIDVSNTVARAVVLRRLSVTISGRVGQSASDIVPTVPLVVGSLRFAVFVAPPNSVLFSFTGLEVTFTGNDAIDTPRALLSPIVNIPVNVNSCMALVLMSGNTFEEDSRFSLDMNVAASLWAE